MPGQNFNRREGWAVEDYDIVDRIRQGDIEIVQGLIKKFGINHPYSSYTLLCNALQCKQRAIAKLLLLNRAAVNPHQKLIRKLRNYEHVPFTPLHYAVYVCDDEIMESLLQRGANVNYRAGSRCRTPLFESVVSSNVDMMQLLLAYKADVNIPDSFDTTPLEFAAERGMTDATKVLLEHRANIGEALNFAAMGGSKEVVELLMSYGAKANLINYSRNSPIHTAAANRHRHLVEYMLECGAHVDAPASYCCPQTLLCVAVDSMDPAMVDIVLTHRPDVKNRRNQEAVDMAVRSQKGSKLRQAHTYGEIIEKLVLYGFSISDENSNSPLLLFIAMKHEYRKTIEDVLSRRSNFLVLRNSILTKLLPLYPSTFLDKSKLATLLVKYGGGKSTRYSTGQRPRNWSMFRKMYIGMFELLLTHRESVRNNPDLMQFAVVLGHLEIVKCLIGLGVDVNAQDSYGRSALHFCVLRPMNPLWPVLRRNRSETKADQNIVKFLLSKNANVNAVTTYGETPLLLAAENNLRKITDILLNAEVDVNAPDVRGNTALHHLAHHNDYTRSKILLLRGANVHAKRKRDGFTPLHVASQGHREIAQLLLEYGADINCASKNGTPLHVACLGGFSGEVKFLVEYGADVNATVRGATPMDYAALIQRNPDIPDFPYALRRFESANSSYSRTLGFLSQHLAKMKAANLFLNEKNLKYTGYQFYRDFKTQPMWEGLRNRPEYEPSEYQTQCEKEVALIKCTKIDGSNFSFYDVLVVSEERVIKLSANKNLMQVVLVESFEKKFPIYANLISERIFKGNWFRKLREECSEVLFAIAPGLPRLCIERIIDYLTVVDLQRLASVQQCP